LTKINIDFALGLTDTDGVIETYVAAVDTFIEQAAIIRADQFDVVVLGEWTARDLLGHTNRAVTLVRQYASAEEPPPGGGTAADYYVAAFAAAADPAAIAQRGRDAGAALGANPIEQLRADRAATMELLLDPVRRPRSIASPFGTFELSAYLESRIVELVVHTDDLTRGLREAQFSAVVRSGCLQTLSTLAVLRGSASAVTAALTGRVALPPQFTVF
jgi:hypothetical protein